ncbi:hypothetical protein MMC25_000320 [Agyrium rufum]|nr:hypothetical protein [Agyrium rufum]
MTTSTRSSSTISTTGSSSTSEPCKTPTTGSAPGSSSGASLPIASSSIATPTSTSTSQANSAQPQDTKPTVTEAPLASRAPPSLPDAQPRLRKILSTTAEPSQLSRAARPPRIAPSPSSATRRSASADTRTLERLIKSCRPQRSLMPTEAGRNGRTEPVLATTAEDDLAALRSAIEAALGPEVEGVGGWKLTKDGKGLEKEWVFLAFLRAKCFIEGVLKQSLDMQHHPIIMNIGPAKASGISRHDAAMVEYCDSLAVIIQSKTLANLKEFKPFGAEM